MRKLRKITKCGFTLIEILLVVAILVLLLGSMTLAYAQYIDKSHEASESVDAGVASLEDNINTRAAEIKDYGF